MEVIRSGWELAGARGGMGTDTAREPALSGSGGGFGASGPCWVSLFGTRQRVLSTTGSSGYPRNEPEF